MRRQRCFPPYMVLILVQTSARILRSICIMHTSSSCCSHRAQKLFRGLCRQAVKRERPELTLLVLREDLENSTLEPRMTVSTDRCARSTDHRRSRMKRSKRGGVFAIKKSIIFRILGQPGLFTSGTKKRKIRTSTQGVVDLLALFLDGT